jgi:hypothetical protein
MSFIINTYSATALRTRTLLFVLTRDVFTQFSLLSNLCRLLYLPYFCLQGCSRQSFVDSTANLAHLDIPLEIDSQHGKVPVCHLMQDILCLMEPELLITHRHDYTPSFVWDANFRGGLLADVFANPSYWYMCSGNGFSWRSHVIMTGEDSIHIGGGLASQQKIAESRLLLRLGSEPQVSSPLRA